ncbi:MAG: transcription-repair coupling factor [Betaproteobacteria bacterium]|nr:transcription-repair coupling factor [Betaproteobacteria bacterium]
MLFDRPLPAQGLRTRYSGLQGSSDALALAQLSQARKPLVLLTASASQAQRLREEIPYFSPQASIHLLPDWETLPYDNFSPHQDLVSERLATLYQMQNRAADITIVPAQTALYRLPPPEFLAAHTFFIAQGDRIDVEGLRAQLSLAGYTHVTQVLSPGEYSVRGGIIDLFPMGSAVPYRLDLFDNEVETLRTFDVDTQRSIYPIQAIRLLPAREFPLDEAGIARFRQSFRETFEGDPSKSPLYRDVSQGLAPAGIEYYLPLFFEKTATLFDYLPPASLLCLHGDLRSAIEDFERDTRSRHDLLRGDRGRPILPPQALFLGVDAFLGALKAYPRIEILPDGERAALPADASHCATGGLPGLQIDRRAENPVHLLAAYVQSFDGRILVAAESPGRRETMLGYFREYGLSPAVCESFEQFRAAPGRFMLGVAPVSTGFVLTTERLAVITENELYATQVRPRSARDPRRTPLEGMLRDLSEVKVGDPVVHEEHGIGRYLGLIKMDLGEGETEFLQLEYAGGDKLYVPVSQLHLIGRYSGAAPEAAPLHRLGSGQWEKAKRRALKQVRDTAAELLNLYAQRAARQGHAFGFNQHDYEAFADAFGFEETADQAAAIQSVTEDMRSGRPMDRLICGDVGFGKTEVALRAAFIALMDARQVAVLVPTTLLAEQHFQNFSDRFADWPVRLAELSRFRGAKEQADALKGIAEGRIDLVIGTHRLLQGDVKFKNLGLVIIDEEHRFGVRQKERLKALRAEVDVLTLTATPIPRTLAMALEGLRGFSVIATAPQRRLAIKTFVSPYSDGIIREAALRELKRGGQIYFLHNEVETIYNMQEKLTQLLPEARIEVAHGQMRERALEQVMRGFYQQRFNVLLCTTIIETGIDVPSANTIIINRADRFGLAQLHQLRGRVGRSHHQAYAYLLTPSEDALTVQAKKRLEAIQALEELGSGFYLAMHDLEIRGAGEVLGEAQSGEMQEVGFNLYTEMLTQAVEALRQGKEPDVAQPLGATTDINLHVPALLPDDYCGDIHERLVLYKRLANCAGLDDLDRLHEELIDRFGLPPDAAQALLETHRLRLLAQPLGISRIDAGAESVLVQFVPDPPVGAAKILALLKGQARYRLSGPDKLRIEVHAASVADRVSAVKTLFKELS